MEKSSRCPGARAKPVAQCAELPNKRWPGWDSSAELRRGSHRGRGRDRSGTKRVRPTGCAGKRRPAHSWDVSGLQTSGVGPDPSGLSPASIRSDSTRVVAVGATCGGDRSQALSCKLPSREFTCLLCGGARLLLGGLSRKLCWNCTTGAELWSRPLAGAGEAAQPAVLTGLGLGLLSALYRCWCWRVLWLAASPPKDESLLPIQLYCAQAVT
ncbi:unnamed protein product [Lepidochelys olivacea]